MRWRTELMFQVAIFTGRNPPMLQLRDMPQGSGVDYKSLYFNRLRNKANAILLQKVRKTLP